MLLALAISFIFISKMTMRAVTLGGTSATPHMQAPVPAVPRPPAAVADSPSFNIETNPLLLLDRGIPVRDLHLHGVRLGDATDTIPRRFVTRTAADEIRCYDGNAYGRRGDTVTRIVLNDPAILLRLPCRECLNVLNRFGAPDTMEEIAGDGDRILFTYAARGMVVRWNRRTSRIDQVVLTDPE
jgi:hypothetical protein